MDTSLSLEEINERLRLLTGSAPELVRSSGSGRPGAPGGLPTPSPQNDPAQGGRSAPGHPGDSQPPRPRADARPGGQKRIVPAPARWGLPPAPAPLRLIAAGGARASPLDPEFDGIAAAVAAAKTKLDGIPEEAFEPLMRALDLYAGLKRRLRQEAGMVEVTNASLKILELLALWPLLPPLAPGGDVRAFFNAELPGAFILATHHYVRAARPTDTFRWLASSFAPAAGSGALDDKYGLWREYPEQWLMGPDCDGDLTRPEVVCRLANAVHARYPGGHRSPRSGATLYTSDAGVDVSGGGYNRQEEMTAHLNFGQAVCGLLSLAVGGSYATKMYTFCTPFSRSLIALVASYFEEAAVVKPLTSRPANSEVYLVGRGFRGITVEAGMGLLGRLGELRAAEAPFAPLVDLGGCRGVEEVLVAAAAQIHGRQQVAFLEEAMRYHEQYPNRGHLAARLQREAQRAQDEWLDRHRPPRLLPIQQLIQARAEPGPRGRGGPEGRPGGRKTHRPERAGRADGAGGRAGGRARGGGAPRRGARGAPGPRGKGKEPAEE